MEIEMNVTNVMNMCVFFSGGHEQAYTHTNIPLNMRIMEQELEKKEEPELTKKKWERTSSKM